MRAISFVSLHFFSTHARVIWVLTAGFGDGHNTAARSVAEALRRRVPEVPVRVSDVIEDTHPRLARVFQSAYQMAIIRFPWLWRMAYAQMAKPEFAQTAEWCQPILRELQQRLETEKPKAIVCTYPSYAGLLEVLRNKGVPVPPVITIITDSISVHPIWVMAPSDVFCVADEDTHLAVEKLGVPAEKLRISGFPVSLAFTESVQREHAGAQILYLPSTPPVHVAQTLEALKPLLINNVKLTLPVGKHGPRLYHLIRRFTDANPTVNVEIIGWTNRIPHLLQTHDAVICKAGGAILHEVLAAKIPAVIDYVVPGQEEGNAELLLRHDCALRSHTPQETGDCVRRLLENNAALGQQMRRNIEPLSEPEAAFKVVDVVLETITR